MAFSIARPFALGLIVLSIAAAAALLTGLGRAPLFLWDESMYCRATAEMANGASWLYATADGTFDPAYGKPPFVNWAELASTTIFGWSIAALRLLTALGMLANILLIAMTGKMLGGKRLGLVAGALVLVSSRMMHTGRHILLEDLLAPLFALTILVYAKAFARTRWLVPAAVATVAAILTKQAFALVLPAAIVVAELASRTDGWRKRVTAYGALVVVPVAAWYAIAYQEIGNAFLHSMLDYHLAARFTTVLEGHQRGLNAYAAAIADHLQVLPWPIALIGWLSLWRTQDVRRRFVFLAWTALVACEYVVVGVAVKTFLPWYQVVVMALFFIGAARVLIWAWHRGSWARFAVIAVVTAAVATSARVDAVAAVTAALIIAALVMRHEVDARIRYSIAALATCIAAVIIANPLAGGDGRTAIARQLTSDPTTVVSTEWLRVWACYAPTAQRVEFTSCEALPTAPNLVLEGPAHACQAPPNCTLAYDGTAREDGKTTPTALFRCQTAL